MCFDVLLHATEEREPNTAEVTEKVLSLWLRHAQKLEQLSTPSSPTCTISHVSFCITNSCPVLEIEALETIVLQALVWSLGYTLDRTGRAVFDNHLRERLRKRGCARPFPSEGTVFDYFFDWGMVNCKCNDTNRTNRFHIETSSWRAWSSLQDSLVTANSGNLFYFFYFLFYFL